MVVCPCLTCGSWARQVSQFRDRRSGEENTSSRPLTYLDMKWLPLFLSLTLYALPLSWQQSWICFSTASAHFSDLCSLVSHKWWVRSFLCSSCLSQGLPVLKRPKCPWFSWYLILKSILMVSFLIDLQWYRDNLNIKIFLGNGLYYKHKSFNICNEVPYPNVYACPWHVCSWKSKLCPFFGRCWLIMSPKSSANGLGAAWTPVILPISFTLAIRQHACMLVCGIGEGWGQGGVFPIPQTRGSWLL